MSVEEFFNNLLGRNCTMFDDLRLFSYREVRNFKRQGMSRDAFQKRLELVATGINSQFPTPLPYSEIRATSRSVAKWVWTRFSDERFSQVQTWRQQRSAVVRGKRAADRSTAMLSVVDQL